MSANATTLANLLLTTIASTTECPHHKKMREDAAKLLANADHSKMDHSNHASHGEGAHNLHEGMIVNKRIKKISDIKIEIVIKITSF